MPTVPPPFKATPRQNQLAKEFHDPGCTRLLASGAIRSGKTQAASRLLVEAALQHQSLYLVARATYRELKDSTQRAMLYGDGSLPPLIPHEAMLGGSLSSGYRASDEQVTLVNGSQIIFRSLEENKAEKIRNLSLGGILVDQIEELRFEEGERLYDELLGRLSDPRGPQKLICVANPAGTGHWLYRRFIDQPDERSRWVHFTMHDNAQNLGEDYVGQMVDTKQTRPAWYRTFVLGEWGAIENAAYHVPREALVDKFELANSFERFEALDYGFNGAPWCLWAVDYDGNLIAVDMLYARDTLPTELCRRVLERRANGWGDGNHAHADPSLWHRTGTVTKAGDPASLDMEFTENGVHLLKANNDPRAGLARGRQLLAVDPDHPFPMWHERAGEPGAPHVFFVQPNVQPLIAELRDAPLQPLELRDGGEIVDPKWESRQGHAAAMFRYAVMTRPQPSTAPVYVPEDPREAKVVELFRNDLDDAELDALEV